MQRVNSSRKSVWLSPADLQAAREIQAGISPLSAQQQQLSADQQELSQQQQALQENEAKTAAATEKAQDSANLANPSASTIRISIRPSTRPMSTSEMTRLLCLRRRKPSLTVLLLRPFQPTLT